MLFDSKTTLQEIVDWMNKWLVVQRTAANLFSELPTTYMAFNKFADAITIIIDDSDRMLQNEFMAHESWDVEPYKGQGIWLRTLCTLAYLKEDLCLFSYFNGERRVLLHLHAVCKDFADGDDKCHAVVSIELPEDMDGSTTVYSVLSKAAWEQFDLEPDAVKRWLDAPEAFSAYHPICPVCCAKVRSATFGGYPDSRTEYRMTCDFCGWTSHKQYSPHNDNVFTSKKCFTAEVKYNQKRSRTLSEKQEVLEAVDAALQKLDSIWKSSKYAMSDDEYRHTLENILKAVQRAQQASKTNKAK